MADEPAAVPGLLRRHQGGHAAVTNLELFFDLVYVFAVTQISHFLHVHSDPVELVEAAILFLAIWWAWIYTAWATNWANPDSVPVRLMMLTAMLASLVLAMTLPHAFDPGFHAIAFAGTYCLLEIGRTLFMVWVMRRERPEGSRNMLRIALWFVASAPFWLAGAVIPGTGRIALWGLALAIEYGGPLAFFRVPGLGRSSAADWDISGGHIAERASLFVLIALGEGIVVTGSTFAESDPTLLSIGAFLASFVGSALMWWIYFDRGAERGAQHIARNAEAGRIARGAYTYLHMPIVAGIVATAVADAALMSHPEGPAEPVLIAAAAGGLIVFLTGLALFKRAFSPHRNLPLSHLAGLALLLALVGAALVVPIPAVGFAALCSVALLVVAVWEWGSYHGGWRPRLARRSLIRA